MVTGATGLVGSSLIRKLLELKAHVVALVRDHTPHSGLFREGLYTQVDLVQGSLEEYASVERGINEYEIEVLFHLGAQTIVTTAWRNPLATFEANIRGTYHVLEACRHHCNKIQQIVIASSDKAYGSSLYLPYEEELSPLKGAHPYDVSKSCADLLSLSYFQTYHLPLAIARCGNIYGGGDLNWSRLIPGTIRSFLREEPPILRSNGSFKRDYLFVEDAVDAYLLLAESLNRPEVQGEAFNFGQNQPFSAWEIIRHLQEQMNCHHLIPEVKDRATHEIKDQWLKIDKAKKILGWNFKYSLQEGLSRTIKWYEQYLCPKEVVSSHI